MRLRLEHLEQRHLFASDIISLSVSDSAFASAAIPSEIRIDVLQVSSSESGSSVYLEALQFQHFEIVEQNIDGDLGMPSLNSNNAVVLLSEKTVEVFVFSDHLSVLKQGPPEQLFLLHTDADNGHTTGQDKIDVDDYTTVRLTPAKNASESDAVKKSLAHAVAQHAAKSTSASVGIPSLHDLNTRDSSHAASPQ